MSICESRLCISNKHNHPLFNVTNKWRYGEKVQGNQTSPKGGLAAELKFYLVADTASWISLTFPQQLARKIYRIKGSIAPWTSAYRKSQRKHHRLQPRIGLMIDFSINTPRQVNMFTPSLAF